MIDFETAWRENQAEQRTILISKLETEWFFNFIRNYFTQLPQLAHLPQRPRTYLEIGGFRGASLSIYGRALPEKSRLCSIDSAHGEFGEFNSAGFLDQTAAELWNEGYPTQILHGNSHTSGTWNAVKHWVGESVDVLFIDGDHSAEGTLADYNDYAPALGNFGIIAIHNINGEPGTKEAWRDIQNYHSASMKQGWHTARESIECPLNLDSKFGMGLLVRDPSDE